MKKYLFTMALVLLTLQSLCAKEVVIQNPHVEFNNSATIEITKIVLTDSHTLLYARITYRPRWWVTINDETVIKNSDGDQSYLIKGLEGGELNTKLFTPDCGYQDLVLQFDAIDKDITTIDLLEKGEYEIYGIDLTGKKTVTWDSELPQKFHGNWSDKEGIEGWTHSSHLLRRRRYKSGTKNSMQYPTAIA